MCKLVKRSTTWERLELDFFLEGGGGANPSLVEICRNDRILPRKRSQPSNSTTSFKAKEGNVVYSQKLYSCLFFFFGLFLFGFFFCLLVPTHIAVIASPALVAHTLIHLIATVRAVVWYAGYRVD